MGFCTQWSCSYYCLGGLAGSERLDGEQKLNWWYLTNVEIFSTGKITLSSQGLADSPLNCGWCLPLAADRVVIFFGFQKPKFAGALAEQVIAILQRFLALLFPLSLFWFSLFVVSYSPFSIWQHIGHPTSLQSSLMDISYKYFSLCLFPPVTDF